MVTVRTAQNSVGTFHNALVTRYYQENPNGLQKTVTPKVFATTGRTLGTYLTELGFDAVEVEKAMRALRPELERSDVFAGGVLRSPAECITILVEDVIKRDGVSSTLAEALRQTVKRGLVEQIAPEAILDTVNRTARTDQNRLSNEQLLIDTFVDVANASSQLWFNRPETQARIKRDSKILLADAAGALIGLGAGGIGSIVGGALWSVAVAEATA